jgi:nicotinate-nucleotide adenylyltransferase
MIRRALAELPNQAVGWEASDLELQREGRSYSFDTLAALHREGLSPLQIFFITGADAFAEIDTWHRYPDVLDAAHFVVVTRPGTTLASLHARLPALTPRMIVPSDLADDEGPSIILLDAPTPDVSSTDIRRRTARGESLAGLVPLSVAAYISEKSLYRTEPVASLAPNAPVAPDPGN